MAENKRPDDEMESLSRAIVDAIINSRDVRKAMRKISEADDSYSKSFMVLMLKLQNLADSIDLDKNSQEQVKNFNIGSEMSGLTQPRAKKNEFKNFVDGKRESTSEIAFREFLASRFNQEDWLRKNGLTLE